jgi:hypothetical protein
MKSTIFIKPLEYNLTIDGEKWRQGDKIKGLIKIINHSNDKIVLPVLKLNLAVGNFKKVKTKDKKAWDEISNLILGNNINLEANAELEFEWNFELPEDCQITDKNGSIYLTITIPDENNLWPIGLLELNIIPKIIIEQFLEIITNFLRFKVNQIKYSKQMVEIKLLPPSSREFGHIESLVIRMKEVKNILNLEYNFSIQAFETISGNVIIQKKTKEFSQEFTSKQYYIYGHSPHHEFIKSSVESIIRDSSPKMFTT